MFENPGEEAGMASLPMLGNRMILKMQDLNFAQIFKFAQFFRS